MANDRIKQQTVVAQVMGKIRSLIASGAYSPGDKIPTEKELAEQFGIGRSSIREAIKIFNYLGVLESQAARGTFVRERSSISSEALTWSLLLGNDDLEEIIDLRGAIELWCLVKLVDGHRSGEEKADDAIEQLNTIVGSMEEAVQRGARHELVEHDFDFHHAIIQSAGAPLFSAIFDTLKSFLRNEIETSQNQYEDPALIPQEHGQLIEAIVSGERIQTLRDYMAHITNIKNRLRKE
ncbi:MAG: FadR family transcriptional regulator [Spirochaetales bacterium]|nr:FadR family transcriptional regulator [Spirochaetales bacterium]